MEQSTASLLARAVRGLEWVVADEVAGTCPATGIRMGERSVLFDVPSDRLSSVANLRTADDVFLRVAELPAGRTRSDVAAIAERAARTDLLATTEMLRAVRDIPLRPAFDVVANMDGNRRYNRFDVEEAVGRRLAATYGWRWISHRQPSSGEQSDLTMRLMLENDSGQLAVRVAAHPLHRRPYKIRTGPGTLHPPLARMLSVLADPQPGDRLGDPFCGDGTILIEAGDADIRLHGCDLDPDRVRNAVANARRAGRRISLVAADAGALPFGDRSWNRVVTNPPWNVAVGAGGRLRRRPVAAWEEVRRVLDPAGRAVALVGADDEVEPLLRKVGLPVLLQQTVRISGRIGRVLLLGGTAPLPDPIARWRGEAAAAGLINDGAF